MMLVCEQVTSVTTRLILVKLGLCCVVYEGSLLCPAASMPLWRVQTGGGQ